LIKITQIYESLKLK